MILIDNMKNLKIYRTKTFLPTAEDNKKKKSAIVLLTPNQETSIKLMNHPLFINKKRFESYFLQRDVSYYINSKVIEEATIPDYSSADYEVYNEMTAAERNKLPNSSFGVPEKRKFPLNSAAHVRSAIKFFNYVDPSDEERLAKRLKAAMKKYGVTDVKISDKNRFSKYYNEQVLEESYFISKDDYKYNIKNFNDYLINLLFITGFAGSGKSTTAIHYAHQPDTQVYELDDVVNCNAFVTLDQVKKYGDMLYQFFISSVGKKYWDNKDKDPKDMSKYLSSITTDFVKFSMDYANKHKKKRYVIEGIYIYKYIEPKYLQDYAVIVKGTSGLKSAYNAANRDFHNGAKINQIASNFVFDNKQYSKDNDLLKNYVSWLTAYKERNKIARLNAESVEPSILLSQIPDSLNTGDKVLLFGEDAKNDTQLKRILYTNRIRTRKEILSIYDTIKKSNSWIKYTFPELKRYGSKNVFIDTYYYNSIFFENNTWVLQKGLRLYSNFMSRLIDNPIIKSNGYDKKTIFIPIIEWDRTKNGQVWNFRNSINPISCIYQMMYTGMLTQLKNIFKDNDVLFIGNDKYFKLNFENLDSKDIKKTATKFKMFLIKICNGEEFDIEDVDTTADNVDSPDVIQAKVADKIEDSKGVDITPNLVKAKKKYKELEKPKTSQSDSGILTNKTKQDTSTKKELKKQQEKENNNSNKDNASKNTITKQKNDELNKDKLAMAIVNTSNKNSINNDEDALDNLDTTEIRSILTNLDVEDDNGKSNISAGRSERINKLDEKLLNTEVKGKTVKEILNDKSDEKQISTELPVSGPNKDEWKDMTFMNFDKNYNIDKDIIACFHKLEETSYPISIRKLEVTNDSTSEDRTELYHVEMEDFRNKRFTVNLDIPIMVDNRFLLRGNYKSIQTQFFNMPIIKTNTGTTQLISNYMKIFLYAFRTGNGRSIPASSKVIKALSKYKGSKIKATTGNNTKVSAKYTLPIDYVDIGGVYAKVETDEYIIFFNQDEIRKEYTIDESKGVPIAYDKKKNQIIYLNPDAEFVYWFVDQLCTIPQFKELYDNATRSTGNTYSRASIMSTKIPVIVICGYHIGLRATMDRAGIEYTLENKLTKDIKINDTLDWIKFKDGYVVYNCTYESSMLMSGLKDCPTEDYELADIDDKNMYLEFLDLFGGRFKADGLDNFYDLFVDPMTKRSLEHYHMPTDYIGILIYGSNLLCDNNFFKHTDMGTRKFRRYEIIAAYTYKVLADAYSTYANIIRHSGNPEFNVKKSAVIDKFLTDKITSDDSVINALRDLETTNAVTAKGPSGMNTARAYDLDKRGFDDSMLNVLGMSTGFAGNVGLTRQATLNSNVDAEGYVKTIDGDTDKMGTAKSLTATEAVTPFGSTHDDPMRSAMTFIQTAKHEVRTVDSDPLLVSNGGDEALPYMTTDRFAFKAKKEGKIKEITDDYIIIEYKDKTKDFVNLRESIEKNSDGGYFVPLKLDRDPKLKVGSAVKPEQILAYDKESFSNSLGETNNIAYNVGKLAKVAIINSDEGYEDSGIISNSLANKLATRIDYQYSVVLDKETDVFQMLNIGDHVEANHNLMIWETASDDENTREMLRTLSKNYNTEDIDDLGKRTLKSEVTGTVSAIKIYRTCEVSELSPTLKKIVTNYEKPLKEMEKKFKENGLDTSQIPAHYVLPPTGKLKKAEDAVLIEFYVEYKDTVGIGDKVVYFSANKAVEKGIFPAGKEPYTKLRPNEIVDAFVAETSIDKRLVTSSIIIGSLNKLMIELDRSVKDILGIKYDDSTV